MQRRELVRPREEDPVATATLPWSRGGCWKRARVSRRLLASKRARERGWGAETGPDRAGAGQRVAGSGSGSG